MKTDTNFTDYHEWVSLVLNSCKFVKSVSLHQ
jgi:hypothetical protein